MSKIFKIGAAALSVAVLLSLPLVHRLDFDALFGAEEAFADTAVFTVSGDGCTLESLPDVKAYSVPATYDGRPVTAIGENAFAKCESLVTVKLPQGLRTIGDGAFAGCRELIAVELPDTLTAIGDRAFARCASLASVFMPASVRTVGDYAFGGCGELKEIALTGVTSIGTAAFSLCRSLAVLELSDALVEIGDSAFYKCDSLREVVLPAGVERVGPYAFSGCAVLTLYAKAAPPELGNGWHGARPYYLNARGLLRTGGGVYYPAEGEATLTAFDPAAATAVVPSVVRAAAESYAVTKIGDNAFADCAAAAIALPETINSVGANAFRRCAMREITLPAALTSIGKNAFTDCFDLEAVYIDSPTIAAALVNATTCGNAVRYASKIAVRADVTSLGSYLTALRRLPDETRGGFAYAVYTTAAI